VTTVEINEDAAERFSEMDLNEGEGCTLILEGAYLLFGVDALSSVSDER
jgi:hypothetical protein